MKVQLIPVLDIFYSNKNIEIPKNGPFWEYPNEWNEYNNQCVKKIGIENLPTAYLQGSSFYPLSKLNNSDLEKLILKHIEDFINDKYSLEGVSPLYGGYVLRINEIDKFFPQCCSDLSDIKYWKSLVSGKDDCSEGHPQPIITFGKGVVNFDFNTEKYDEQFVPPILEKKISITKEDLKKAIDEAQKEVKIFAERVKTIHNKLNLKIENIENILIWKNE